MSVVAVYEAVSSLPFIEVSLLQIMRSHFVLVYRKLVGSKPAEAALNVRDQFRSIAPDQCSPVAGSGKAEEFRQEGVGEPGKYV